MQFMKSKLKYIAVFFCQSLLLTTITTAQPDWEWAKGIGSINDNDGDGGCGVAVDANGYVYTVGTFWGTVDFDPGAGVFNLTSAGAHDIFVSKLNASGDFVWAKRMGSPTGDGGNPFECFAIVLDDSSNVYTTGHFWETSDFDPGSGTYNLTSAGQADVFVSKLTTDGNFVWAKRMGGSGRDWAVSITRDASGNVYTTGNFDGSGDYDPGSGTFTLTSNGNFDIFISKLDGNGDFVWAKSMGSTMHDQGFSITVEDTEDVGVYTTGNFRGTVDFDPGSGTFNLTSQGSGNNAFILKLDGPGNFAWAKAMGGTNGSSDGRSISVDIESNGDIYSTGNFEGTVDFDPGSGTSNLTSAGSSDIFISKLESDGDFIWAKQLGGSGNDRGKSLSVYPGGDVYATGFFRSTADFDPGAETFNLTSVGQEDIFISQLNPSGEFVWADKAGGNAWEWGVSIMVDNLENIHLTGFFSSAEATFGGFTLTNAGDSSNIYIVKLDGSTHCTIVTNADDSGAGSLRATVDCAAFGDTIRFDSALIDQTIILTSGEIGIKNNLVISGLGTELLTISGNNSSRIFNIRPGWNVELLDMKLINATEPVDGGSILVGGNLTLQDVILENNFENGSPKGLTLIPGAVLKVVGNVNIVE
jgi:hypothetical protein